MDAGGAGAEGLGNNARFPINLTLWMVTETPVTEKQRMPVPEQSMIVESSEAPEIVTLPFVAWEEFVTSSPVGCWMHRSGP